MLLVLLALVVLFVLVVRLASKVSDLESREVGSAETLAQLSRRLDELAKAPRVSPAPAPAAAAPVVPTAAAPAMAAPATAPPLTVPPAATPPVATPRVVAPPVPAPQPSPVLVAPATAAVRVPEAAMREARPPRTAEPALEVPEPVSQAPDAKPGFDWEELVGVRLFSWAAAILLALAAVYFLGYSIQKGWLQPPVQMAICLVVAVTLLVGCELKAARRYPVTANALDGSAVVILFSTFFAAYRLWVLIGPVTASALLALVTVVAVLLSVRRNSVFIALLGLVGGFSTPALLSTGQDNPFGLFGYLLLLNAGLGWVAYRKRWPLLTGLSLLFTTLYQWGWVATFLTPGKLPVASAIFLAFPIVGFVSLGLAGRAGALDRSNGGERRTWFEEVAGLNAALPLLFAVFMATSQAYGEHPALMFGFLFCVDAGLFAIALWRRQPMLHVIGAVATLVVFVAWTSATYASAAETGRSAYPAILGYVGLFVALYLAAGLTARRGPLRLEGTGRLAVYVAPLLLFVFPTLAAAEPQAASPALSFAVLFALLAACGAYAAFEEEGIVYFIGAFWAVAAEAAWSAHYLTGENLLQAVAIYGLFGLLFLGVPLAARRWVKPLEPEWLGGVLLLVSIALLRFLSNEAVATESLWGLAVLLGVLNVALMIEGKAARFRWLAVGGGALSWLVVAAWWLSGALTAQIIPALMVVGGLSVLTLGGQLWADGAHAADDAAQGGMSLALVGHVFLLFVATQPALSIPPWPMFAVLAVLDLAVGAVVLYTRRAELFAAALGLSQVVLILWATVAGVGPWPLTAMVGGTVVAALGLAWSALASQRVAEATLRDRFDMAAAVAVALGQALLIVVSLGAGPPGAVLLAAFHLLFLLALLALAAIRRWHALGLVGAALTWIATWGWQATNAGPDGWLDVLILATPIYLVFLANPLVLGKRVERQLWPHLAAVMASASFFHVARQSVVAAGYGDFIGALPLAQAALLGVVLAGLLRIEPPKERTLGRLALVAGSVLAFITVAIPLQLDKQWITIAWALEGAALAWLYRRIPHRGLFWWALGLLAVVFVRLALNPEVLVYQTRSEVPIVNWYLYTYLTCAAAVLGAGWLFSTTDDRVLNPVRASQLAPAAGTILLFFLLNIEIADFFATGDTIRFNLSAGLGQNLTYTLGWAVFAVGLLTAGIALRSHAARLSAIVLLTVAALKGFLSDVGRLPGLYRVMSLVGLAVCLSLVAVVLQRFVLSPRKSEKRE
jgi:uncharacterized membrane protein